MYLTNIPTVLCTHWKIFCLIFMEKSFGKYYQLIDREEISISLHGCSIVYHQMSCILRCVKLVIDFIRQVTFII